MKKTKKLLTKVLSLVLVVIMALTMDNLSGFLGNVKLSKAASATITLSDAVVRDAFYLSKDKVWNVSDDPIALEDASLSTKSITELDTTPVIHMDVCSSLTFHVSCTDGDGKWKAYIADANDKGILVDTTTQDTIEAKSDSVSGGELLDHNFGFRSSGTGYLELYTGQSAFNLNGYYLYVYNPAYATKKLKIQLKFYNPVTKFNISGDHQILGKRSKQYKTTIQETRMSIGELVDDAKTTTDKFIWDCSDTTKATISSEGVLTAKDTSGNVIISAVSKSGITESTGKDFNALTKRGVSDSPVPDYDLGYGVSITQFTPAKSISFSKEEYRIAVKDKLTMTSKMIVSPDGASDIWKWESSNTKVATISAGGELEAKAAGTTEVTVYSQDDNTIRKTVTVRVYTQAQSFNFYSNESSISTNSMSMRNNNILLLKVKENGSSSEAIPNEDLVYTCSDSSLLKVEFVNEKEKSNEKYYKVTVLKDVSQAKDVTLSFRTDRTDDVVANPVNCQADFTIHVLPKLSDSASLSFKHGDESISDGISVYIGDKDDYALSVFSGEQVEDQYTFTFKNNVDYVTSTIEDNIYNRILLKPAETKGVTTLIATSKSNPSVSKSILVNVLQSASSINLNTKKLTLNEGDTATLIANQSPETSDESVVWTSSNTSAVTVDANGKVTAVSAGDGVQKATITATTSHTGKKITCEVTVIKKGNLMITSNNTKETKLSTIEKNMTGPTAFSSGNTAVLYGTVFNDDGSKVISPAVQWESDNENVATIVNNGDGKATVTFHKVGKAEIKAKFGDDEAVLNVTISCPLNVATLSEFTISPNKFTYLPNAVMPKYTVSGKSQYVDTGKNTDDPYVLVENTDFTVFDNNNGDAGNKSIILYGGGLFNQSRSITGAYTIDKKDISEKEVECELPKSVTFSGYAYTGLEKLTYSMKGYEPEILDTTSNRYDYKVAYSDNIKAGTAKVTITGYNNFTGTREESFVIEPRDMSEVDISDMADMTYSGTENKPTPSLVYINDKGTTIRLTKDTDYTLSYKNNVEAGTATVIATAVEGGNFKGSVSKEFTIVPRTIVGITATVASQTYTGKPLKPEAVLTFNQKPLVEGVDYTLEYDNNVSVGTAKVYIKGIGNFKEEAQKTFSIAKSDISKNCEVAPIDDMFYSATNLTPDPVVTNGFITLVNGVDYTCKYENNYSVGTAKVTITGIGSFLGTLTKEFNIVQKEKFNNKATSISITADSGSMYKDNTLYVDVNSISSYNVSISSDVGKTDDIVFSTLGANEQICEATTTEITDGTTAKLLVKGKKPGSTVVYLNTMSGSIQKQINVVVYQPATSFKIMATDENKKQFDVSSGQVSLIENHTVTLKAAFTPSNSTDKIEWSVSDLSKATISEDGLLTTISPGTVLVTAKVKPTETSERGLTTNAMITIIQNNPATSITLNKTTMAMKAGDVATLVPTVMPENNTEQLVWESDNENVVKVDQVGRVTAVGKGSARVYCHTFSSGVGAFCDITVATPATGIKLSHKEATMIVGKSAKITAGLTPSTAEETFTWTSTNPKVATIEAIKPGEIANIAYATVKAVGVGKTTLTCRSSSGKVANCTLSVVAAGGTSAGTDSGNAKVTIEQQKAQAKTKLGMIKFKSVKNNKKKTVTVKWAKVLGAVGYQLKFATKKSFKAAKTKATKATTVKLKGLKKKKTYYLKVRAYAYVAGKKVYGKYSQIKKIKIKK